MKLSFIYLCIAFAMMSSAFAAEFPSVEGALFFENFQGEKPMANWVESEDKLYNNAFDVVQLPNYDGDKALSLTEMARRYGISAPLKEAASYKGKDLVIQYEARILGGTLDCGGMYLKLVAAPFDDLKNFKESVPYSIMFGPDKCGASNKVHFIMQTKNPKTEKLTEHHLQGTVSFPVDSETHIYTLKLKSDETFEILIDGEVKKSGKLMDETVIDPPFQPPKEIDDEEDKKPDDWVDDAKIPDPEAIKPDDWDETAPKTIPDETATKPEGWLDDAPLTIPDPEAEKPEEWDEEEDGEWEAPTIPNPACEAVGCGEWKPPTISNPAYKGKWSPPMIDNPDYKGVWKPRKIPNPGYFEVESVEPLDITAVGIEVWTMTKDITFDNILISNDFSHAEEAKKLGFDIKAQAHKEIKAKEAAKPAAEKEANEDEDYGEDEEDDEKEEL